MERRALQYSIAHNLLEKGDGIVVGVSGGADSMSLLLFLMSVAEEYRLRLLVLHVNHGIRGESAYRDQHYVENFCRSRGLECRSIEADIPRLAKESGCSEEEAGRNLRYREFERACRDYGYNKIAVAHNRDDNAETVLFNIFRGSGISGARGITPSRRLGEFTIIRPLLDTGRDEIEAYLVAKGLDYCTDETNLETDYSRNRIRQDILPYVRDHINERASDHIAEFAKQAAELEAFLEEATTTSARELEASGGLVFTAEEAGRTRVDIKLDRLKDLNPLVRRSLLRRVLGRLAGSLKDLESKHVEALEGLAGLDTGKQIDLPYGLLARRDYDRLVIEKRPLKTRVEELACEVPGEYRLGGDGSLLRLSLKAYTPGEDLPKNDYTKWFDYDKITNGLFVRGRRQGDFLLVASGSGDGLRHKSLKDYFIDTKTDRTRRDEIPLLAEGSHVLWVIGGRRDDSCKVTGETRRLLIAELIRD